MTVRIFPLVLCLLVALVAPPAAAQSDTPAPTPGSTTIDQTVAAAFQSVIGRSSTRSGVTIGCRRSPMQRRRFKRSSAIRLDSVRWC